MKYTAKQDQTVFDIALQLYDDPAMVYQLISDNPDLINIHPTNLLGFSLTYSFKSTPFIDFVNTNNITIVSGLPIVNANSRQFDDSFDESFR